MTGSSISIRGLHKTYAGRAVLDGVDIDVAAGSLTCLLGPSGSGKSTVLGCVSGLVEPDSGSVSIDGEDLAGMAAHVRPVTMMMQQPQLFPFLSVVDNVAFGLRARKVAAAPRRAAALASLQRVGLGADRLDPDRSVDALSGGEAQRVSLARALAVQPSVLLLDEPLASLDPPIRRSLQELLRDIHADDGVTMVLVTHDRDEALSLADHLVVLDDGAIRAAGHPRTLFDRPPSRAAAELLGVENVLDGAMFERGGSTVAIRPESVGVTVVETGEWTVERGRYLGVRTELTLQRDGTALVASVPTVSAPPIGASVDVTVPDDAIVTLTE